MRKVVHLQGWKVVATSELSDVVGDLDDSGNGVMDLASTTDLTKVLNTIYDPNTQTFNEPV